MVRRLISFPNVFFFAHHIFLPTETQCIESARPLSKSRKIRTAAKILDFGKDLGRVHQGRKADKARDAYHMHHAESDYKVLLIDPAFLIID